MEQDATISPQGSGIRSFDEAHRRLLEDGSIQFDLPQWVPPTPPKWLLPLTDFLSAIAPFLIYFFWTCVVVGVAIVLALIFVEMTGVTWKFPWQRETEDKAEVEAWRPDTAVAQILLSEADELASKGRYDEAVHLLLRRSVADIAQRMPDFLRPSLTARDIAGSRTLPEQPRSAFDRMRAVVETAVFARRTIGVDQWQEARHAYEQFAFRDAWA